MNTPHLQEVALHKLHPTQLTVGLLEVKDKKHELKRLSGREQRAFLAANPIPAVVGPEATLYMTDHHHLGRAALEAGVESGYAQVEADLSALRIGDFWKEMDARTWVHPLDENGVRHRFEAIPRHLEDLVDDVYRSLARRVRAAGGYRKTAEAFAEFVWADFFRRLIPVEDVRADFEAAAKQGVVLAHGERAERMPGFEPSKR